MNIDDFIFAEEGGASVKDNSPQPTASSHSGPQTAATKTSKSSRPLASAIPIKGRKGSSANQFVAQSVPVAPPHQRGQFDEFHYVPRHDRKTSIDDRRVSAFDFHWNRSSYPAHQAFRIPRNFSFLPFVIPMLCGLSCMARHVPPRTLSAHP